MIQAYHYCSDMLFYMALCHLTYMVYYYGKVKCKYPFPIFLLHFTPDRKAKTCVICAGFYVDQIGKEKIKNHFIKFSICSLFILSFHNTQLILSQLFQFFSTHFYIFLLLNLYFLFCL